VPCGRVHHPTGTVAVEWTDSGWMLPIYEESGVTRLLSCLQRRVEAGGTPRGLGEISERDGAEPYAPI